MHTEDIIGHEGARHFADQLFLRRQTEHAKDCNASYANRACAGGEPSLSQDSLSTAWRKSQSGTGISPILLTQQAKLLDLAGLKAFSHSTSLLKQMQVCVMEHAQAKWHLQP